MVSYQVDTSFRAVDVQSSNELLSGQDLAPLLFLFGSAGD